MKPSCCGAGAGAADANLVVGISASVAHREISPVQRKLEKSKATSPMVDGRTDGQERARQGCGTAIVTWSAPCLCGAITASRQRHGRTRRLRNSVRQI